MTGKESFERLVLEAEHAAFSGWDFSHIKGRWNEEGPTWDYESSVRQALRSSSSMLDMGTGGGEFLFSLVPMLPAITLATEAYSPNIPIAKQRLEPLGIQVIPFESDQQLPVPDDAFDLVINRHESFTPSELHRVLQPHGLFITQQVGGRDNDELNRLLKAPESEFCGWDLKTAVRQLRAEGFTIIAQVKNSPARLSMILAPLSIT